LLFCALLVQVANVRPSSTSIPHRRRQAEESGDPFAVLPALIRVPAFIRFPISMCSTIMAGITGLLVSTTASWLPVLNLQERVFFLLIYCTATGIFAGQYTAYDLLGALQLHKETKDLFVKLKSTKIPCSYGS
jgi:hypothetical protein